MMNVKVLEMWERRSEVVLFFFFDLFCYYFCLFSCLLCFNLIFKIFFCGGTTVVMGEWGGWEVSVIGVSGVKCLKNK